jgi:hypothetical protein
MMFSQRFNRACGRIVTGLALVALVTVLTGFFQPPQRDEGTGAHIFQLAIVLLVPALALFVLSADWSRPLRAARPLLIPLITVALAFAGVYRLDHYH